MLLTQYRPRGVRLDPWRDFDELRNRLDRYFLNPFEPGTHSSNAERRIREIRP
jgi:hypothetical protein